MPTWVVVVIVAVVVLAILWVVVIYNGLVRRRNRIDAAWSQIDVQLRRRNDLIPNLVETVKGYAVHERETFEAVVRARTAMMGAQGPRETAAADQALTGALKSLFAVAEGYPVLRANENFLALQEELTATEDKVAYARQYYNDQVYGYNTRIQTVPSNIVAGMFHFEEREYFEAEPEATGPVEVSF